MCKNPIETADLYVIMYYTILINYFKNVVISLLALVF